MEWQTEVVVKERDVPKPKTFLFDKEKGSHPFLAEETRLFALVDALGADFEEFWQEKLKSFKFDLKWKKEN